MSAFRQSVEAMIPALRRYARALTRDADAADDLVQDTLVRALRSERLFLGGDVRSWLYTILTNLNKNRRRSLARRPQFMPLTDNNPDASGTEAEGRDIEKALATLVEEQRSVLLLVMLEGMSYREVADIQGRADRHRDVAPGARKSPRQSLAGGRAYGAQAGEMMAGSMHRTISARSRIVSCAKLTRRRHFGPQSQRRPI
ncbi:RNA polymerase sigma factor (sigma-70 family) [Bradyrhizobium yuanmingense]|uniref:RNA polymerase sigma factor (Sigma-70 family) n=1 Tax=Bradyrhizobium yuanmingense TaxID=108015 RepID=A0ABV4GD00_9BRAD